MDSPLGIRVCTDCVSAEHSAAAAAVTVKWEWPRSDVTCHRRMPRQAVTWDCRRQEGRLTAAGPARPSAIGEGVDFPDMELMLAAGGREPETLLVICC